MREDKKLMDKNPALFYKTFVVGIVILFLGSSIVSSSEVI